MSVHIIRVTYCWPLLAELLSLVTGYVSLACVQYKGFGFNHYQRKVASSLIHKSARFYLDTPDYIPSHISTPTSIFWSTRSLGDVLQGVLEGLQISKALSSIIIR